MEPSIVVSVCRKEDVPRRNLLDLPRDIKDEIYDSLFYERYVVISTSTLEVKPRSNIKFADFAIFQVSKRVYREAPNLFFS